MRRILTFLAFTLLAACGERNFYDFADPVRNASVQQVFVATQRDSITQINTFGHDRDKRLQYFRATVSIPPGHKPGTIEWPGRIPDARTDFVLTEAHRFPGAEAFRDALWASDRAGAGQVMIYVPGFNTNIAEATYRVAQIREDFQVDMPTALFSWPTAGDPRGYIYDRDSAVFARDALETLIGDLTDRGQRVVLFAHSLGSFLVMESIRQMSIRDNADMRRRVASVVLMSPDIDQDVFEAQVDGIGTLPGNFVIFTTRQDRVLRVSGLLTGARPRLGTLENSPELEARGITIVDVSDLAERRSLAHNVPVTSPRAIAAILQAIEAQ